MEIILELPKYDPNQSETGCCPRFDPNPWDEKLVRLDSLKFAQAQSRSLMFMPLNLGSVMTRSLAFIHAADAEFNDRYLILSQDVSPWRCNQNFWVQKDVPELKTVQIKGLMLMKVFEGPFQDIPKWIKALNEFTEKNGYHAKDIYSFYTTCPKCAKVYGKNYVVLFAKVAD